jgi:hypothetical protein
MLNRVGAVDPIPLGVWQVRMPQIERLGWIQSHAAPATWMTPQRHTLGPLPPQLLMTPSISRGSRVRSAWSATHTYRSLSTDSPLRAHRYTPASTPAGTR